MEQAAGLTISSSIACTPARQQCTGAWHPGRVQSVYEAVGADKGVLTLAHAWHARVLADEVVSHAFSHGYHPEHTKRLAVYWIEALGGPEGDPKLIGDETSVVRMHSGNGPHDEMDRHAIACFDLALADAEFWTVTSGSARYSTTTSVGRP